MFFSSISLTLLVFAAKASALPQENLQAQASGSLSSWIATESPLARSLLLANIGSNGGNDRGSASGVVVASPSDTNPNCLYFDLSLNSS